MLPKTSYGGVGSTNGHSFEPLQRRVPAKLGRESTPPRVRRPRGPEPPPTPIEAARPKGILDWLPCGCARRRLSDQNVVLDIGSTTPSTETGPAGRDDQSIWEPPTPVSQPALPGSVWMPKTSSSSSSSSAALMHAASGRERSRSRQAFEDAPRMAAESRSPSASSRMFAERWGFLDGRTPEDDFQELFGRDAAALGGFARRMRSLTPPPCDLVSRALRQGGEDAQGLSMPEFGLGAGQERSYPSRPPVSNPPSDARKAQPTLMTMADVIGGAAVERQRSAAEMSPLMAASQAKINVPKASLSPRQSSSEDCSSTTCDLRDRRRGGLAYGAIRSGRVKKSGVRGRTPPPGVWVPNRGIRAGGRRATTPSRRPPIGSLSELALSPAALAAQLQQQQSDATPPRQKENDKEGKPQEKTAMDAAAAAAAAEKAKSTEKSTAAAEAAAKAPEEKAKEEVKDAAAEKQKSEAASKDAADREKKPSDEASKATPAAAATASAPPQAVGAGKGGGKAPPPCPVPVGAGKGKGPPIPAPGKGGCKGGGAPRGKGAAMRAASVDTWFSGRRMHWRELQGGGDVRDSIFEVAYAEDATDCVEDGGFAHHFDWEELDDLFVQKTDTAGSEAMKSKRSSLRKNELCVLRDQQATMAGIGLRSVGDTAPLCAKLKELQGIGEEDVGILQELLDLLEDSQIERLRQLATKEADGTPGVKPLRKMELWLVPLAQLDRAKQRLRLVRIAGTHEAKMKELQGSLEGFAKGAEEACASSALKDLIRAAMRLRDYVQHGPQALQSAAAMPRVMDIGSLLSGMREFKATGVQNMSLLQFFVRNMLRSRSEFDAELEKELPSLVTPPRETWEVLLNELAQLRMDANFVKTELAAARGDGKVYGELDGVSCKNLEALAVAAESSVTKATESMEASAAALDRLGRWFGFKEDAKSNAAANGSAAKKSPAGARVLSQLTDLLSGFRRSCVEVRARERKEAADLEAEATMTAAAPKSPRTTSKSPRGGGGASKMPPLTPR
eukprot:TRINITY_DN4447_c0_g1_i1.p1 TRINITY_DN4447_c0_g1~~TRINITY_DN4447_c0_g1_i1.p1  ORF type:complete len:1015 (+),score=302.24 TRINITY_DN4447_c0_g1_i1:95-3139(+)